MQVTINKVFYVNLLVLDVSILDWEDECPYNMTSKYYWLNSQTNMPSFKTNRCLLVIHHDVSLQVCYIDAISHKIEFGSRHTRSGSLKTGSVTSKINMQTS